MPMFSVVIPFYNAKSTLAAAIASLQAQTFQDWEALFINDGSTDGSADVVLRAAEFDTRIYLIGYGIIGPARGVAATRNIGIAAARGRFIAFLDSDDLWLPEKLDQQMKAFERGADIVFTAYRRIDYLGRNLGTVYAKTNVNWADSLGGNPIGCSTGAYRLARFPTMRMREGLMHEDYAFWLDLLRDGAIAQGLPNILAEYRVSAGSVSANKLRSAAKVWHILGLQGISLPQRVRGFIIYILMSLWRRQRFYDWLYRDKRNE